MEYVLWAIGSLLLLVTVLPLLHLPKWWIRVWDFPRLQITVLSVVIIIPFAVFYLDNSVEQWLFLAALAGVAVFQGSRIVPYTLLAQKETVKTSIPNSGNQLSILSANIYIGNKKVDVFIELVKKYGPDIILAVETDQYWAKGLYALTETFPHYKMIPRDNTYGMVLLSKLELKDLEVNYLVQDDIPSIKATVLLRSGKEIELYCVHPDPPMPYADPNADRNPDSEGRDAELLIIGKRVKKEQKPAIVTGDLNDVAWSFTTRLFQKISGMLDPRKGRYMYNTFHAKVPFMRFPLDHFFLTDDFTLDEFLRLEHIGSDHFPIYLKCTYNDWEKYEQEEKQASAQEKKEAEEKIEEGLYKGEFSD